MVNVELRDPPAVSVTMDGLNEAMMLEDRVAVRETEPAKTWRLLTVIVEVSEEPTGIVSIVGLAEMSKSTTSTVTSTEWTRGPLVPVTVMA